MKLASTLIAPRCAALLPPMAWTTASIDYTLGKSLGSLIMLVSYFVPKISGEI